VSRVNILYCRFNAILTERAVSLHLLSEWWRYSKYEYNR